MKRCEEVVLCWQEPLEEIFFVKVAEYFSGKHKFMDKPGGER